MIILSNEQTIYEFLKLLSFMLIPHRVISNVENINKFDNAFNFILNSDKDYEDCISISFKKLKNSSRVIELFNLLGLSFNTDAKLLDDLVLSNFIFEKFGVNTNKVDNVFLLAENKDNFYLPHPINFFYSKLKQDSLLGLLAKRLEYSFLLTGNMGLPSYYLLVEHVINSNA